MKTKLPLPRRYPATFEYLRTTAQQLTFVAVVVGLGWLVYSGTAAKYLNKVRIPIPLGAPPVEVARHGSPADRALLNHTQRASPFPNKYWGRPRAVATKKVHHSAQ